MRLLSVALMCCAMHAAGLRYWVQPCSKTESGCRGGDEELAQWAMEAWQAASAGGLVLERASAPAHAHIRVYWTSGENGLYGEARPIVVDGARGAEVYVRKPPVPGSDTLLRDAVVYLTCLHETGHALGMPHTAAFADIMYSFQYGGDIPEYFGRYRRQLSTRADIRRYAGLSEQDRKRIVQLYPK